MTIFYDNQQKQLSIKPASFHALHIHCEKINKAAIQCLCISIGFGYRDLHISLRLSMFAALLKLLIVLAAYLDVNVHLFVDTLCNLSLTSYNITCARLAHRVIILF